MLPRKDKRVVVIQNLDEMSEAPVVVASEEDLQLGKPGRVTTLTASPEKLKVPTRSPLIDAKRGLSLQPKKLKLLEFSSKFSAKSLGLVETSKGVIYGAVCC